MAPACINYGAAAPGLAAPDRSRDDNARGEPGASREQRQGDESLHSAVIGAALTSPAPERLATLHTIRDRHRGLDSSTQRACLLEALQTLGSVSTFEGSRHLDLYDPRARAKELRQAGHRIVTVWRTVETESRARHRIGVYVLQGGQP